MQIAIGSFAIEHLAIFHLVFSGKFSSSGTVRELCCDQVASKDLGQEEGAPFMQIVSFHIAAH